jgi:hypothetical protein
VVRMRGASMVPPSAKPRIATVARLAKAMPMLTARSGVAAFTKRVGGPAQGGAAEPASCRQLRNRPPGDRPRGLFYLARRFQSGAGHIPNNVARKVRTQQALKA